MDCAELASRIESRILAGGIGLSSRRRAHTLGVAALAAELCARQGLDPERGRAAGLAHDMCKELPRAEQLALALEWGEARPESSLLGDKVAHGPAAAVLLRREYGVEDAELLDAVAYHTLGRPGMAGLEIFLYCADKLEPGRRRLDPAFRERCLSLPPEAMLGEVVASVVGWLEAKGEPVARESLELLESLSRRIPAI